MNGKFTVTVNDPNATIVFSFIGYATKEIKLEGKTVLKSHMTNEFRN